MNKLPFLLLGAGLGLAAISATPAFRWPASAPSATTPPAAPALRDDAFVREVLLASVRDFAATRLRQGLDETQRVQVAAVLQSHRDDIVLQAHARLGAQRALRAAIHSGADEAAVDAAAARAAAALADGARLRRRLAAEIAPVLRTAQRAAWVGFAERVEDRVDAFFAQL